MLRAALALAALLLVLQQAWGQAFPSKPITLVVPFPAGGPTDALARLLAEPAKTSLGQPVVVENASGAGGSIAITRVGRAAPDGHTLIVGNWTSHIGAPAMYPLQFDVLKDFEPITRLPSSRLWIVGRTGLPAKDAAELIAWLKASPTPALLAITGQGGAAHVCGLYFESRTGVHFQVVPYRGAGPLYQDMLAGSVDLTCADAGSSLAFLRSGKIRAYAVLGASRWPAAPEVPTLDEVGVPGLDLSLWTGLWAPKGTPKEVVAKLNSAFVAAMGDATLRKRSGDLGFEFPSPELQTPEGFAAFYKAETEKWWPVIKAAGIKAE